MPRSTQSNILRDILIRCHTTLIVTTVVIFGSLACQAKSYPFKYNKERSVTISQSSVPGTKIVRVVSFARNAKKAMDLALQDAVYAAIFTGLYGDGEFESVPPILTEGAKDYQNNKKYFDQFFKKGEFLSFARHVNSEFPSGLNNVSSPKGRKVTVYIVVDYTGLAKLLGDKGFRTVNHTFNSL